MKELLHTNRFLVIAILLLGLGYQALEGLLIKRMVHRQRADFTYFDGIKTSIYVAFYRVVTFGAGTFISEVAFYHKKKLPYSNSVGIAMFRLMLYKFTLVVYALVSLLFFGYELYQRQPKAFYFVLLGCIVTSGIVGLLLALTFSETIQRLNTNLTKKILRKPSIHQKIDQFNDQIEALRTTIKELVLQPKAFIELLGLSLLKMSFWYAIPVIFLCFHPHDVSLLFCFAAMTFAVILAGVLPAPAGIGSFEFVYLFMFQGLFGTVEAASSLVLYRVASYILPFVLGSGYVIWDKKQTLTKEFKDIRQN